MKKNRFLIHASLVVGLLAALGCGCKKETPASNASGGEPSAANGAPANSTVASAGKTSFNEVTSQLDAGGNFYLYLSTAQWLDGLSGKVSRWQEALESMPQIKDADRANVDKGFTVLTSLIKDSGIEDLTGLGMSSIETEKGMYRNKLVLHHYPGNGSGFLWKLGGEKPHALTGLDFLPDDTALAIFSDMDLKLLWSVIQNETAKADFAPAQQALQKLPEEFEQKTQVKWDDFLNSLGGEFGFVLTLDESNNVPVPLPPGRMVQIPSPAMMLVLKVNDDTIFNRIEQELKKNQQVISVNRAGFKMRTMPVPLPLAVDLRPSAASSGGYLFIASSDALINDALAVQSRKNPGLKGSDEFKHLAQGLPEKGNQFSYMSKTFGKTIVQIQQQLMAEGGQSASQTQWMRQLFARSDRAAFGYSVGVNTDQGCLTVGNGSQSEANLALLPAIAVPGMLAAVAIPNFVKARATSQVNACINNLRMIDAAKNQWALENGKTNGASVTQADLLPYIGRGPNHKFPQCPAGGTYTIGAVGEVPTCSIPGHTLPN